MQVSNRRSRSMGIYCIVLLAIAVFLPTSVNKQIMGLGRVVLVWLMIDIILVAIGAVNKIATRQLLLSLIIINVYMITVTMLSFHQYADARFSIARVAPIITLIFLCSLRIRSYPKYATMITALDIVTAISIIWNACLILNVGAVTDFTYNWFNQYFDLNGHYQLVVGHKPVMSYGVHTYAAFYYFLLYVLCLQTYTKEQSKRHLLYSFAYMLFTLFLVSTTAIIFFVCMVAYFVYRMRKHLTPRRLLAIALIVLAISTVIYMNFNVISTKLYANFTNGQNSFISRYSKSSVFTNNFKLIQDSLGIGYTIVDSLELGYSDSGYIVYLSMGNIPFTIALYETASMGAWALLLGWWALLAGARRWQATR